MNVIKKNQMEKPLLNDQHILPTEEVLEKALERSYPVYDELIKITAGTTYGLMADWNYYKDGKAWLCKVCYRKKTVFWLSVWDKYFKIAFYFTEKNKSGIDDLDIDIKIKDEFRQRKPIGKLIPLVINIHKKEQLMDLLKIIDFKKSLQ
jgi:hypothetical protein